MRIPKPCTSVHLSLTREKKSPWLRQYQFYICNWYFNGKVFTSTTPWKPQNLKFVSKKFEIEFWLVLTSWNHLSFVNISPTLVIDTSMERSSRVLQHGNPKCEYHKIQVAKARKYSSVKRHFPRLCIGVAQQCYSDARCSPWKQHLYLLPQIKFY